MKSEKSKHISHSPRILFFEGIRVSLQPTVRISCGLLSASRPGDAGNCNLSGQDRSGLFSAVIGKQPSPATYRELVDARQPMQIVWM